MVDHFTVTDVLGSGHFADVFKATTLEESFLFEAEKEVAIKSMKKQSM